MTVATLLVVWVTAATTPVEFPPVPHTLDLEPIRALPLQHDGRWPPLDTVARDLVESVTGSETFLDEDPVAMLLAWTFDASKWRHAPLISIRNAELRSELHLAADRTGFSYEELAAHRYLHALVDELQHKPEGEKQDPLEAKVSKIYDKLITLQSILGGNALDMIPNPDDALGAWRPIPSSSFGQKVDVPQIAEAWTATGAAFLADDRSAFAEAGATLIQQLGALPAAHRPAERLINTELRYNRLQLFSTAWQIMVVGAMLALIGMFLKQRWFDALVALGLIAGFAVLTYGLWLRWQIAGRIPASNMFESLLFLSWGAGAFAVISMLLIRDRIVPLTASGMGAMALMLADLLPMNHFIRPIAPVLLDTVWMSIHVPIIMISYSVLALGVLVAHAQMVLMAIAPGKKQVAAKIDSLHYWYIHVGSILLFAGIVTGSMWAASSWGRYWGWDPKEVWSLVALLGYLTILHVRIDQERVPRWAYLIAGVLIAAIFAVVLVKLAPVTSGKVLALSGALAALLVFVLTRGPLAMALKSILCFWLIIMTYVGVNYVLGIGLHSYGFGTGAVVHYMFWTGSIDLAFVAVCTLIYLIRRSTSTPDSDPTTIALPTTGA